MTSLLKIAIVWQMLSLLVVLILLFLSWRFFDKRYKNSETKVPPGYLWTEEVSIDSATGNKERVYYNPETGDRFYKSEK
jgi:hypothetical protein